MYIEPNTIIRILRDCPLDNTYNHTIFFNNASEQASYFQGLTKYTLTEQTYQRVNKGTMRVARKAEELYDCNYIMFQNTSFGNKWFYAFIKSVEYVNNVTAEITFELDVMQTWFFDYELGECFVDREHSASDNIGENTIPENLETGAYITTATSNLTVNDLGVYILVTEKLNGQTYWNDPGIVGGFPIPCYWVSLSKLSDFSVGVLRSIIAEYSAAGKADAIVAIFTAPYNMVSTQDGVRVKTFSGASRTLSFTPKNKKLYSYPYCCLAATALGQGVELRYELFDGSPTFKVRGGFGANMQVSAIPQNYAGMTENIEYTLSIKDFPVCAWVNDYYQNWIAQNKASIAVNTISTFASATAGAVGSALTGNYMGLAGSIIGGVSGVANQLASAYQHSIIPDKMSGSANAADILAVSGLSGFYTSCKAIQPEYGRRIDDFFTMYGYKTNRIKTPNRNVRPHWTYTKTHDCVAKGSVPCDDMNKICRIYDNGITFWNNGNHVGNYSLDNRV